MKIGVDVDGVLIDLERYQLNYGRRFFGTKHIPVNKNAYDIQDIFECSRKERQQFWAKYIWRYCLAESARQNASTMLQKLHDTGHEIFIVTSRVYVKDRTIWGALFRKMLIHWLKSQRIPYDGVVFCSEKDSAKEKADACEQLNIDIMLEDKVDNIEAISAISNIVCFDAGWNKHYSCQNMVRVDNFEDAYHEIVNMIAD